MRSVGGDVVKTCRPHLGDLSGGANFSGIVREKRLSMYRLTQDL